MNYLALWDHALDHLNATDENPAGTLALWRSETPDRFSDLDLFREYAWVVYACGLTPHVLLKHWDRLGEAYWQWNPAQVAAHRTDARVAALGVMKNPRKIEPVLDFADDLAREPGLMQRLAAMELKQALARLTTLPFVGATNKYHFARNLGWDVVVRTGPVARLAGFLELAPEDLCGRIARETGERIRTVDLVLWNWGYQVGDKQMKEMASLFKWL